VVSFSLAVGMAALAESGDERSDLEEILDDIGLFEATIDADSLARGESGVDDPPADVLSEDEDRDGQPDEPRGEPFVAPIPFRSPSLGWGGALAAGYIFRIDPDDRDSPPSTVSLAGFGTENESFGGLLSGRLHVAEDRWRVTATAAGAQVNYDFFGIGSEAGDRGDKIEIEADSWMGRIQLLRRLPKAVKVLGVPLYLGPSVQVSRTENSLSGGMLPPGVSAAELDETRVGLGVHLQRDSRDDSFYPKQGSLADLGFQLFESGLGSDFSYRVYDVSYRRYDELWTEGVLASRAFGRFTDGNVPFTDLSGHDLRGYERGRYRDEMHLAGELELRQLLFWRVGGAVFAGLGQVAPDLGDFDTDTLLWSAGFGLRFRLTERNRMNYRTDLAWGRDGLEFYFSITEAF
jgi:outer membrane protein assembly factor BamA